MKWILATIISLCSINCFSQDALPQQAVTSQKRCVVNKNSYKVRFEDYGEVIDGKDYGYEQIFLLPNKDGEIQNVNISCIEEVLNIDVINFWNIEGCQTQLKRKIYKESVEYKQRYQQLKKYRNDLLSWQFYYLIKLDGDYDITHKGFPVILDAYEGSVPNIPNYLTKNSLCFDYASSRFPKHKISRSRYFGGSDYFVTQKIYLSVPNEKDALKIENTRSKALLIIFKLDSAFRANPSGLWNRTYLKTKIQSLYIVDTQTEEILAKVL